MEIFVVLFTLLFSGVLGQSPWNDGQDYYDPRDEEHHLPVILSDGNTYTRNIGDRVKLPCQIQNLGDYSVTWTKDSSNILFVLKGTPKGIQVQKVVKDHRIKLKGTQLLIMDLKPDDSDTYACQIQLGHDHYNPRVIHHVVNVNEPPSIKASQDYISVEAKKSVILDCETEGKPKPVVKWARKDIRRLKGRQEGSAFIIYEADREDAGRYHCYADNGVPPQASATIILEVKYPPEVSTNSPVKHIGIGIEATLECFVFANPKAKVEWFRDGAPINPMRLQQSYNIHHNRYSLIFPQVLEEDLGMYTCNASNYYGKGSSSIELTGRPTEVIIISDLESDYSDMYLLVWEVQSYSPILHYIVSYKNVSDSDELWVNLTIPSILSSSNVYSQSYNLSHLTPDSSYNVFITAKNEYGYSTVKTAFNFTTLPYDIKNYDVMIPELEETSHDPPMEEPTMISNAIDERKESYEDPEEVNNNLSSHLVSQPVEENTVNNPSSSKKPYSDNKLGTVSNAATELSGPEKRAQTVAMITAISLSAFFL